MIKTFPMINPGVDNNPDFYSGPDALQPTEKVLQAELVSQSPPNCTYNVLIGDMVEGDPALLKTRVLAAKSRLLELRGKIVDNTASGAEQREFLLGVFDAVKWIYQDIVREKM